MKTANVLATRKQLKRETHCNSTAVHQFVAPDAAMSHIVHLQTTNYSVVKNKTYGNDGTSGRRCNVSIFHISALSFVNPRDLLTFDVFTYVLHTLHFMG